MFLSVCSSAIMTKSWSQGEPQTLRVGICSTSTKSWCVSRDREGWLHWVVRVFENRCNEKEKMTVHRQTESYRILVDNRIEKTADNIRGE